MNIGQKLKQMRKSKNYTQEELGEILNVSRSTISSWEIGRTYPDLSILIALSDMYEVTLDSLLKEDFQIVDYMVKNSRKNDYAKKIMVGGIAILILFILLNISWFFLIKKDYAYEHNWEKSGNQLVFYDNNLTYSSNQPKYLDFFGKKSLTVTQSENSILWYFSNDEIYGRTYIDFDEERGSTFLINNQSKFDKKLNEEIGLTFSKADQAKIDQLLTEKQEKIINAYSQGKNLWEKIK